MKNFIALLEKAAAAMAPTQFTSEQQQSLLTGEVFAEQFIDAAHKGTLPDDALMFAVALMAKSDEMVLTGFLRRLVKELEAK